MRFDHLIVNRYIPGKIGLTWNSIDEDNFYIFVQRSGSPEGPFESLNSIPLNHVYGFIDTTANQDNPYRIFYYRICAINKQTKEEVYSEVKATTDSENSWIGKSISRQEQLLLRRFVGDTSLLYIRKTFGTRCPNCYDPVRGKARFENCTTCWGTTYVNGFFDPIKVYIQYNVLPKGLNKTELGLSAIKNSVAWTSNYPILKNGDFIVNTEGDNYRYIIDSVNFTRDKLGPVRQIMQLIKIDNSNILNQLPVVENAPSIDDVNVFRRG